MGRPAHPKTQEALELYKKGIEPYLICRKLNMTKGQMAGIAYRDRNPWPKKPQRFKEKRFCRAFYFAVDKEMKDKIDELAKEMGVLRSEAIRTLIEFGFLSLEGD